MGEDLVQTVINGGGMSMTNFLLIIAALVAVITILGEVIKSLINRKTNSLNGTLGSLDGSLAQLNTVLTKIELRTADSDRVLEGHTEKLVSLTGTMVQLAASELRQTEVLLTLGPSIDKSLTGVGTRITDNCNARSGAILASVKRPLDCGG